MNRLLSRNHSLVYLDVSINNIRRGRIAIEVRSFISFTFYEYFFSLHII